MPTKQLAPRARNESLILTPFMSIKETMIRLDSGDVFPTLQGTVVGGNSIALPEERKTEWTIILGYRAHW